MRANKIPPPIAAAKATRPSSSQPHQAIPDDGSSARTTARGWGAGVGSKVGEIPILCITRDSGVAVGTASRVTGGSCPKVTAGAITVGVEPVALGVTP